MGLAVQEFKWVNPEGKNHSEKEHYLGLIRNLKSEVRNLRKRIKHLEKKEHMFEEIIDDAIESDEVEVDYKLCSNCGKGVLERVDLKYVVVEKCSLCDFRRKLNGNEKKES